MRDAEYIERTMLRMVPTDRRRSGRPKKEFIDVIKEDMREAIVTEEEAE